MRWVWFMLGLLVAASVSAQVVWTDVPGASGYKLHIRQVPTPFGTGTPLLTRTPITVTPRMTPQAAWRAPMPVLPPGQYEAAVSAYVGTPEAPANQSGLSNVLGFSVPTPTDTATATMTSTRTPTATITVTPTITPLNTPQLLDLSGNGIVTAYDAAIALRRGQYALAWCLLRISIGVATDCPSIG